jgi:hypothetical protein
MNEICSGASIDNESINENNIIMEKQKEEKINEEGGICFASSIVPTTTKSSFQTLV